jgi:hypothetical protein
MVMGLENLISGQNYRLVRPETPVSPENLKSYMAVLTALFVGRAQILHAPAKKQSKVHHSKQ